MPRKLPAPRSAAASAVTLAVLAGAAASSAPVAEGAAEIARAPRTLYVHHSPGAAEAAAPSPDEAVTKALKALPEAPGTYDVAVADLDTGARATYASGKGAFDTASIVKVDILAALLLQAQDEGRALSAGQEKRAAAMIRSSDNDATDALWAEIGGGAGLDEANRRLGLTGTEPGDGGTWGLTQTTASDQLALLEAVYGDGGSPLSDDSRHYVEKLMTTVVGDQRWGVSAAADDAGEAALKNGWLPRSATGLWDVNSIGRVEHRGHTLLVAVLSDGHASYRAGIDVVENVTTAAANALRD
ncbi:serine hydrolase [Streptomyces sp. WMMC500]|uniref:serine hydrolase n=1 Tax=Streptomyces sp. WMMC500 TaxID=3015154 RepID=UPI00248B8DA0|nr:serine hydrolase [Streptomyces sp. WMMC500]WBB61111.1 serine hydrolase [Streptomyces sp. WMMC500]